MALLSLIIILAAVTALAIYTAALITAAIIQYARIWNAPTSFWVILTTLMVISYSGATILALDLIPFIPTTSEVTALFGAAVVGTISLVIFYAIRKKVPMSERMVAFKVLLFVKQDNDHRVPVLAWSVMLCLAIATSIFAYVTLGTIAWSMIGAGE